MVWLMRGVETGTSESRSSQPPTRDLQGDSSQLQQLRISKSKSDPFWWVMTEVIGSVVMEDLGE